MIILPFFLILAILPTITEQVGAFHRPNSIIDWSECFRYSRCFCANDQKELDEEQAPIPSPSETDTDTDKCDIGMQNKFFNEQTAVFQLQVIDSAVTESSDSEMALVHNQLKLGCKKDSATGKVELTGSADHIKNLRVSLFETRSYFKNGAAFCAFKMERAYKLKGFIEDPSNSFEFSIISVKTGSLPTEFKRKHYGMTFFQKINTLKKCDPYSFKDLSASPIYDVLPVEYRDRDVLNCAKHGPPAYTMRYEAIDENKQKVEGELKELKCVRDTTGKYSYTMVKTTIDAATSNPEEAPLPTGATVFCAAKVEELCEDPNSNCPGAQGCPAFDRAGASAKLTCTGDKWLINGEYYDNFEAGGGEATCKKDIITKKSAFFITPKGSSDKKVGNLAEAKCFTDYDCVKKSKLSVPGCDDFSNCDSISYDAGTLSCSNTSISLSIIPPRTNVTSSASRIKCDPATGGWVNASGSTQEPILANSRLRCFVKIDMLMRVDADLSGSQIGMYIGITIGVAIVVVAVILVIYHYVNRKQTIKNATQAAEWKRSKKKERIEKCKKVYGTLMAAGECSFSIGFIQLGTMLETETAEPECWDEVWPFLARFRHAVRKTDFQCWYMFGRYLFLQAKKIIDKHGWTSTEPFSESNTTPVLRAVAIRLLTYSLGNHFDPESRDLIRQAYCKLGFKGRQQYPSCGLVWATLTHTRPWPRKRKKEGPKAKPQRFDPAKYVDKLSKIAFNSASVLPAYRHASFGSCSQQAAFALGAYQDIQFHMDNAEQHLLCQKEGGGISKAYFAGMVEGPLCNPYLMIQAGVSKSPCALLAVARKEEWDKRLRDLCHRLTWYDLHFDRQKVLKQFKFEPAKSSTAATPIRNIAAAINALPNNETAEYLVEFIVEQQSFEKKLENEIEDIRAFLAKNSDKEELKVAPVYLTEGKVKLDTAVATGKVKDVEKEGPANSCGGSDKSDGKPATPASDPKDGAGAAPASAPSDPKDPKDAATPAAPASAPGSEPAGPDPPAPAPAPAAAAAAAAPAAAGTPAAGPPSSEPAAP